MSRQGALEDERGFTLVEVIVTILLMGMLFAIASSMWFGAIESRRVDSATNQLAVDLRQAHSRAINRLANQTVTLTAGSSEYIVMGAAAPFDLDEYDEDVIVVDPVGLVDPEATITFEPDGSASLPGDASSLTLIVSSADGEPDDEPNHDVVINAATSEIEIVP